MKKKIIDIILGIGIKHDNEEHLNSMASRICSWCFVYRESNFESRHDDIMRVLHVIRAIQSGLDAFEEDSDGSSDLVGTDTAGIEYVRRTIEDITEDIAYSLAGIRAGELCRILCDDREICIESIATAIRAICIIPVIESGRYIVTMESVDETISRAFEGIVSLLSENELFVGYDFGPETASVIIDAAYIY